MLFGVRKNPEELNSECTIIIDDRLNLPIICNYGTRREQNATDLLSCNVIKATTAPIHTLKFFLEDDASGGTMLCSCSNRHIGLWTCISQLGVCKA